MRSGQEAVKIVVFAGSMRGDSLHRKLAREAAASLAEAGAEARYLELKEYPMPLYDGDLEEAEGLPEGTKALQKVLGESDGIAIASLEYNGSFTPLVKNVIDWATRPEPGGRHSTALRGKVAGILSASPGPGGGKRGLRHLRELLEMVGMRVPQEQVIIGKAFGAFDEEGRLVREEDRSALRRWAESVVGAARADCSIRAEVTL